MSEVLLLGNCLEVLKDFPDSSIDSIVCDPPYGLSFMGKKWDYDVPSVAIWQEVLRVLKPGGYLLSFGGTRTYHRMVVNIEDAGFEIRDQIQWLYGSGFPKSHNIEKSTGDARFAGFGTALKPANEPIVLARKPLTRGLTIAENVLLHGTGGLNIDASRVGTSGARTNTNGKRSMYGGNSLLESKTHNDTTTIHDYGRFPANIILDEAAAAMLDEQSGILKSGAFKQTGLSANTEQPGGWQTGNRVEKDFGPANSGGASRFFYVAKASKRERNQGAESVLTWENQDQNLQALTGELSQLLRAISEDLMLNLNDIEWNTILSGNTTTDQFQKDFKFTISTVSKLITESKTSNVLVPLNTNANILDAIRTIEESGLSLVESVECLNTLKLATTNDQMELAHGANLAVLQMLLKIRGFAKQGNVHSTVKPTKLMEYLIKLVTPRVEWY